MSEGVQPGWREEADELGEGFAVAEVESGFLLDDVDCLGVTIY